MPKDTKKVGRLNNGKKDNSIFPVELPKEKQADNGPEIRDRLAGSESVLLMDDEEIIRSMVKLSFKKLGYSVTTALNGEEAIGLYKKALDTDEKFKVVIMDLTIPAGMGAVETIGQLLEIDPTARAIITSGFQDNEVMTQYKKFGFKASVPKPYDLIMLGRILREVLRN